MHGIDLSAYGLRALVLLRRNVIRHSLVGLLEGLGVRVSTHHGDGTAPRYAELVQPRIIFLEHSPDVGEAWWEMAVRLRCCCPSAHLVLLAVSGSEDLAVRALRAGIHDYLALPLTAEALNAALLLSCSEGRGRNVGFPAEPESTAMIGESPVMTRVRAYMSRVAATDCTVLITGETGTGKELAAEYVHQHSARRGKPFVCINCAAIPEPLLESELFGHMRGAFTGAENVRDGLLASADGGTVFLDEIGDMSLSAQAKILRVLEKREVSRLGGNHRLKIDVRFLAATNQDLEAMSDRGAFRRDLFYRLNVARVELPPLRQRREDIPLLLEHYRVRAAGSPPMCFSEECLRRLIAYDWPGNIRELKNVVETAALIDADGFIEPQHLPQRLREALGNRTNLPDSERECLVAALCSVHWNRSKAAEKLKVSRMTLYRRMAKYGIVSADAPQDATGEV